MSTLQQSDELIKGGTADFFIMELVGFQASVELNTFLSMCKASGKVSFINLHRIRLRLETPGSI